MQDNFDRTHNQLNSRNLKDSLKELNVRHTLSSKCHPQSNMVKHYNKQNN